MITIKRIREYLKALLAKTASRVKDSQAGLVPVYLHCVMNQNNSITGQHSQLSVLNSDRFRFNSHWYVYKYSIETPNETFGILKVDNIFTTQKLDEIPQKQFIGTVNRLVHQGYIKPFMLMIDGHMVPWDIMELVYDCGDTWLLLRGEKYNYYELSKSHEATIILYPFRMEYVGHESEYTFNIRYATLQDYLQSSLNVRDGHVFIMSPTLETEHEYNHTLFNVGGWAYEQMKLYHLGLLSDERIAKLRKIPLNKMEYDEYGNIIDYHEIKFNLLDTDVPTDIDLHSYVYGLSLSEYENKYTKLAFTDDGLYDASGTLKYFIVDDHVLFRQVNITDNYIWDLSDIEALLFRENFMIFIDGKYTSKFDLITSVNNMTLIPNPSKLNVTAVLVYNNTINKIITNANKFKKDYINEQARIYLEALLHNSEGVNLPNSEEKKERYVDAYSPNVEDATSIYKNIDTSNEADPISESGHHPKKDGAVVLLNSNYTPVVSGADSIGLLSAQTEPDNRMIRNISTYLVSETTAAMPTVVDYIVYLIRTSTAQEDALDIISRLLKDLQFSYSDAQLMASNLNDSIESVIDYDVNLLNGLYHTGVDNFSMTGAEANESLIHQFMYEARKGIKIPRKLYKHHETYFMMFVNGELFEYYYRTIAYANFFFIPVPDDFQFNDTDIIEVCYFKNVNNNECRFYLSDWLLEQWETNTTDAHFYNVDLFDPYFKPTELKIFAHYPRDMLMYPTLIPEETEDIAFNVSYRDGSGQLCIKKSALTHIVSEDTRDYIESVTGESAPASIADALDNMDVDAYMQSVKDNTYIVEKGINIFSQDRCILRNALVAVSSRKFVYQRLFVDQRSYRIKLDKRFRYCDNPKHYLLFINGRRQRQDSFLVTIPKHTRPFNSMYLYTAVFVDPQDRVELFYLPYDMTDINFDENKRYELQSNGYLELPRKMLDAPLSKNLYMLFVNGKKVPASKIIDVDSHTLRVAVDINTLHYPMLTAVNLDSLDNVVEYLHDDERDSTYDSLIKYVKSKSNGYNILDKMFGSYVQMSDNESDHLWMNVAKIAILNEIIRDFWVTSGYDYHKQEIVYDYDMDEYFEHLDDGTLILPALNAEPDINIYKNDISLLYFYTDPASLMCEYGDTMDVVKFYWEYSQRLNQPWHIISQKINGIELGPDARTWEDIPTPETDHYRFVANTGQQYIIKDLDVGHVNGTYWGLVDADALQYYQMLNLYQLMDQIVAVVPNDKTKWPSHFQIELESGNEAYKEYIADNYTIVYPIGYGDMPEDEIDIWADPRLVNLYGDDYIAICFDGRIFRNLTHVKRQLPDVIEEDLILNHINAMIENEIYAHDIESVDEVPVLPDDAYSIESDYNITSDAFIAIAHDTGDVYHTEFILVKDINNPIPDDEATWEVDAEHSNQLIAINMANDAIIRDMSYANLSGNLNPFKLPFDWEGVDIDMMHESFVAVVRTVKKYMLDVDVDMENVTDSQDIISRGMSPIDDEANIINGILMEYLDDETLEPTDTYVMAGPFDEDNSEYEILRDLTTRRTWRKHDSFGAILLDTINNSFSSDNMLIGDISYSVETQMAEKVIDGDILYDHDSVIATIQPVDYGIINMISYNDIDTGNSEQGIQIDGFEQDSEMILDSLLYQFIEDDANSPYGEDSTQIITESNIIRHLKHDPRLPKPKRDAIDRLPAGLPGGLNVVPLPEEYTYELLTMLKDKIDGDILYNHESVIATLKPVDYGIVNMISYDDINTGESENATQINGFDEDENMAIDSLLYQFIENDANSPYGEDTVQIITEEDIIRNLTYDSKLPKPKYNDRLPTGLPGGLNVVPLPDEYTYEILTKLQNRLSEHDKDLAYNMEREDFLAIALENGTSSSILDGYTEEIGTTAPSLSHNEAQMLENMVLGGIEIFDLDSDESIGEFSITNIEDTNPQDDLDEYRSDLPIVYRNLFVDPTFYKRAKSTLDRLISLRGLLAENEDNVISDLSYISTIRHALEDYDYTDTFGNNITAFHGDFDILDLDENEYIDDPSYYMIKTGETYSESDFPNYYEENMFNIVGSDDDDPMELLINNSGILLDTVMSPTYSYTPNDYDLGLTIIPEGAYVIDHDHFVAVLDSSVGLDNLDVEDIDTSSVYAPENAILAMDLEDSSEEYSSILITNLNGEVDSILISISQPGDIIRPLEITDDEIDFSSIEYLTLNGFVALDIENGMTLADDVTYVVYKNSTTLYDPTWAGFIAISNEDGTHVSGMSLEDPLPNTYTMSVDNGIVGLNIDITGLKFIDSGGLTTDLINYEAIPEVPLTVSSDLVDLEAAGLIAVSNSDGNTYSGIIHIDDEVEDDNYYEESIETGITTINVNSIGIKAVAEYVDSFSNVDAESLEDSTTYDNSTGISVVDLETGDSYGDLFVDDIDDAPVVVADPVIFLEEPYTITIEGGFDPTHTNFIAIPNDGQPVMNELIFQEDLNPDDIVDGPTGYNIGSDPEGMHAQPDGADELISGIQPIGPTITFDHGGFDLEKMMLGITNGNGSVIDTIFKYIFDPIPEVIKPEVGFRFYNLETLGMPDIHADGNIIDGDTTFWFDETREPYDRRLEQIIDFNEYVGHRVIYPEENDKITSDYLYALPNKYSESIDMDEFSINAPHIGLVLPGDAKDNEPVTYQEYPDMGYGSRYGVQNIGAYDIDKHSDGLFDAIQEGTANVIRGINYNIDEYANDNIVITYPLGDNIFARDTENNDIHNLITEDYELDLDRIGTANIASDNFIAMLGDGTRINGLTIIYDQNHPDMRYYYNESDLPGLIGYLDKHLIPEPANVNLEDYQMGNYKYFVFACPKRLVYSDYHMLAKWSFPDITSQDFVSHCIDSSSMPIYTNGKFADPKDANVANTGDKSALYTLIERMKMEFIGECNFTNQFGYTEPYMVWKTNGYFTRLQDGYGIDIGIQIGVGNDKVSLYHNNTPDYDGYYSSTTDNVQTVDYFKDGDFDTHGISSIGTSGHAHTIGVDLPPYLGPWVSNVKHRTDLHHETIFSLDVDFEPYTPPVAV